MVEIGEFDFGNHTFDQIKVVSITLNRMDPLHVTIETFIQDILYDTP